MDNEEEAYSLANVLFAPVDRSYLQIFELGYTRVHNCGDHAF